MIIPKHFIMKEIDFLMDNYHSFKIPNFKSLMNSQYGGGKQELVKFIDQGGLYTYRVNTMVYKDNSLVHIAVVTDKEEECVTIIIDINKNIVSLHNMTYYNNCAIEGLRKPGGGSKLLRFALNLILKYQEKYKFKRIFLRDNSFRHCGDIKVSLAQLRMITHGEPWYMAYGFKPYDTLSEKPSITALNTIKKNNKILQTLKTNSINVINIVVKTISEDKLKNINVNKIKQLMNDYPLMRNFIILLSNQYDLYCDILVPILDELYNVKNKIGLTDVSNKSYYLDI